MLRRSFRGPWPILRRCGRLATMEAMPISDITLDHVAVAVPSIHDAHARWVGELGAADLHGGDNGVFEAHQFRYANGGKLELLQPSSWNRGPSFVVQFLDKFGAGIHHLTFKVKSMVHALAKIEAHGLEVVDAD